MTRRVLTLAEVLAEELDELRLTGDGVAPASPDPASDWNFTAADLFEVMTLESRLDLSKERRTADRYAYLAEVVASVPMAANPLNRQACADRIAQALTELVHRETLLLDLLAYEDFRHIVEHDPVALAAILRAPKLRNVYVSDGRRLANALERFPEMQPAFDDGPLIAELLDDSDIAEAVKGSPGLLGAIIDSAAIRTALAEHDGAKERLLAANLAERRMDRTALLRLLCDDRKLRDPSRHQTDADTIPRVNALLLERAFGNHLYGHRHERAVLSRLRRRRPAALCLSGGGIRSATFNLGVLQGLARHGILPHIDYLSTVSGGGYIGGWLSSWMRRNEEGTDGVHLDLAAAAFDPVEPNPPTIAHLREYSNYLAPRYGLFTPDTWAIIATYFRNLFLNWLILLPPLIVALALPRLYYLLVTAANFPPVYAFGVAGLALAFATIALAVIRPAGEAESGAAKDDEKLRARRNAVWWFLGPALLSAMAMIAGWGILTRTDPVAAAANPNPVFWWAFVSFVFSNLFAAIIHLNQHLAALRRSSDESAVNALSRLRDWDKAWFWLSSRPLGGRFFAEIGGAFVAALTGAALLGFARTLFPTARFPVGAMGGAEALVCLGVPFVLFVFFAETTVLNGAITKTSSDYDREWWARAAGMALILGMSWLFVTVMSLIAPMALTQSPKFLAAVGGISGLVALIIGRSAATPAASREETSRMQRLLVVVTTLCLVVTIAALGLLLTAGIRAALPKPPPRTQPTPSKAEIHSAISAPEGYELRVSKPSRIDVLEPMPATERHLAAIRSPRAVWPLLGTLAGALFVILIVTRALDVNTYSMHSMYRNRLIRAYLGASRWTRRPNPFTGFDPQDNLQMYQLCPQLLWTSSFKDFDGFAEALAKKTRLYELLPDRVRTRIDDYVKLSGPERDDERNEVCPIVFGAINQLMVRRDLETGQFATGGPRLHHDNREYLKKHYGKWLDDVQKPPMHIINTALNLVRGDKLAWQERKAESFTISPLHVGSGATPALGFRDADTYGGRRGISLGTAIAISGAAVSPNMGYNSSSIVTFLMTLFNARLGWWLGNPGPRGEDAYRESSPPFALRHLLNEAFGQTTDTSPFVFLSDGGHFDNLGIYEMVRRRCHTIIACDATGDEDFAFTDLANAVRKIRIDLGVQIEFRTMGIGPDPNSPPSKAWTGAYCAIGRIRYSCIDGVEPSGRDADGRLLYIKPVVYPDMPVDVRNYRTRKKAFPHEATLDQFFSETQFESYRALGAHIVERICGTDRREELSPRDFFARATAYLERYERTPRH